MDKIFCLLIERYLYTARTTIGKMYFEYTKNYVQFPLVVEKEYFCFTLEDTARPSNIKVYAETCLPGGLECDVSLFENDHFKKTIIFHTEVDNVTTKVGALKWVGCLAHNGATFEHTEGCVLVGASFNPPLYKDNHITNEPSIYNGKKEDLRIIIERKISEGFKIRARFVNLDQQ